MAHQQAVDTSAARFLGSKPTLKHAVSAADVWPQFSSIVADVGINISKAGMRKQSATKQAVPSYKVLHLHPVHVARVQR